LSGERTPSTVTILRLDADLRSWLCLCDTTAALDGYLVGMALSEEIAGGSPRGDAGPEALDRVRNTVVSLRPRMRDGAGAALGESLDRWDAVRSTSNAAAVAPAMSRHWQELLFDRAAASEDEEDDLFFELAQEVRWVFWLGVLLSVILCLLVIATFTYALVADGSPWQRLAAGILGAGAIAVAGWSGVTRALGALWQGGLRTRLARVRLRATYSMKLERLLDPGQGTLDQRGATGSPDGPR
jgi:hypothetical protein